MSTNKPTHGNLVWMPNVGKEEIKIFNKTWIELGREKKRMLESFPKYYGNSKLGRLKLRYKTI